MTGKEFEQIYNEAYKSVYWTAMAILKNEADAEDIVQDTFVSFIEAYSEMTDTTKATALLKKIAANKCLNRIKLAKTDTAPDEFFEDVEAVPEDFLPDTIVESAEMRKIIMDIISNSLSEDIRRTLILFYFDEMSTKEIAETLGVPEGTVRRRLNFARNKIKKEVEKYEEENNTKLFGMAALPFLSKLFIKEAEQVPFKAMPASLISTLSASAKASTQAGIKAAASAAQKGTGIMVNKLVIGSVAAVMAVTTIATIAVINVTKKSASKPEITNTTIKKEVVVTTPSDTEPAVVSETTSETSAKEVYISSYYLTVNGKEIHIGERLENVVEFLGEETEPALIGKKQSVYHYKGAHIETDSNGVIIYVSGQENADNWNYLGVINSKSSMEDVRKALGDPEEGDDGHLTYYYQDGPYRIKVRANYLYNDNNEKQIYFFTVSRVITARESKMEENNGGSAK